MQRDPESCFSLLSGPFFVIFLCFPLESKGFLSRIPHSTSLRTLGNYSPLFIPAIFSLFPCIFGKSEARRPRDENPGAPVGIIQIIVARAGPLFRHAHVY
jgi:hypothetical protein